MIYDSISIETTNARMKGGTPFGRRIVKNVVAWVLKRSILIPIEIYTAKRNVKAT